MNKPKIICGLTDEGDQVVISVQDENGKATVLMDPKEAREAFSRMFNIAAAAKDYAEH